MGERYTNDAWLLIGGNMGDRMGNLASARMKLEAHCGKIVAASGIYQTAAWGKEDQEDFLNQAIHLQTELSAADLLKQILEIEKELGRIREEKYGPRIIDIDILLYNDDIIHIHHLTIPHPELEKRRFALVPLAEIAREIVHPVLKKTIDELLAECGDRLDVHKIN